MSARSIEPRRAMRRASLLLAIPIAVGLAACSGAAAAPKTAHDGASNAAIGPAGASAPALGAPVTVPAAAVGAAARPGVSLTGGLATTGAPGAGSGGVGVSGAGVASGTAIAFPYPGYPGAPGLAPDHMIVVTGTGRAAEKADLSDRAGAREKALAAALEDARAQADIVAKALGIAITGVSSVSVSGGETYAMPMMGGVEGATPGAPSGSAPVAPMGSADGTTVTPPLGTVPSPALAPAPEVAVSVTVAYRIG